jgi:hypothetical protein
VIARRCAEHLVDANLAGVDSLHSIVQMPKGVPVATFAIGVAGAANAALFAVAMLATTDPALRDALAQFDIQMTACVALNAEPSIDLLNRLSDAVDAEKATGRRGTTVEYLTTLQSVAA